MYDCIIVKVISMFCSIPCDYNRIGLQSMVIEAIKLVISNLDYSFYHYIMYRM